MYEQFVFLRYCYTTIINSDGTKEDVYIVCVPEDAAENNPTMTTTILVFQFISVIFFFVTIIIYLMLPQMMDLQVIIYNNFSYFIFILFCYFQGLCTIHSMFGLMIGYIVLISENLSVSYDTVKCHLVAYCLYISFLYAFFWLNLCCFNMWRLVV